MNFKRPHTMCRKTIIINWIFFFLMPSTQAMDIGDKALLIKKDSTISSQYLPTTLEGFPHLETLTIEHRELEEHDLRAIAQLSRLQKLNLSNCYADALTPALGNLTNLKTLNLYEFFLRRDVASSVFMRLPSLQDLKISKAMLYEIGYATGLTRLDLGDCSLKKLPKEMASLTQLTELDLRFNRLKYPALLIIAKLSKLHTLSLAANCLDSLPTEMSQLTELKQLDLFNNNLSSSDIAALPVLFPYLETLALSMQNRNLAFTKAKEELTALPIEMGTFKHLRELDLSFNDGIVNDSVARVCTMLPSLLKLDLRNTNASDLPAEFGELARLEELSIGGNKLSQSALNTISKLTGLRCLSLFESHIDELPETMTTLQQLQTLDVALNSLCSMQALRVIAGLHALRELTLFKNGLTGLPEEIGTLQQLQILNLACNNLNKSALKVVAKLSALKELKLSRNQLRELPAEIGNLQQLQKINLRNNNLSLAALAVIARISSLQKLNLATNDLKQLPREFEGLSCLQKLNLSSNKVVPQGLDVILKLPSLQNLRYQFIKSELPEAMFKAVQLKHLDIRDNTLAASVLRSLTHHLPQTNILYSGLFIKILE